MEKLRLVWRGSLALNSSVVELPDTWMSNTHKQRIVPFDLICHNETTCHEIMEAMKETPELLRGLELEYVANAKRTSRKHVAVTGTQFMDSSLFAKLDNLPDAVGSVRYINSDDLNILATEVASNIVANVIRDSDYEAQADEPSVVNIIKSFLGQHKESTDGFSDTKWNSVFWDPEFARPDKITSAVNEAFEKVTNNSSKLRVTERTSRKSGGFSLFNLFGGGGGSNTFTKTTIADKLSQMWERQAHAEWEGEKIVVKPMMLHRVNLAEFNTTSSVTFTDVKLYP